MTAQVLCKKSVLAPRMGDCPFTHGARLALAAAGIKYEVVLEDLKTKSKDLLELNPKGTVPVYVASDGSVVTESLDIISKIAGLGMPRDEVLQAAGKLIPALKKFLKAEGDESAEAEAELRSAMGNLSPVVPSGSPWTADDCILGSRLHPVFVNTLGMKGVDLGKDFPDLLAYLEKLRKTKEWEECAFLDEDAIAGMKAHL